MGCPSLEKCPCKPLFKKATICQNTFTSIICKVLEHIIHSHAGKHLSRYYTLNDAKHVFRKKRSTESQLFLTYNEHSNVLNSNEQLDSTVLDFLKAFEKVSHKRLLHKLSYCGIRGTILAWIQDYLRDRTQSVVVNGETSTPIGVTS